MKKVALLTFTILSLTICPIPAQTSMPDMPKHEFRGAWIASITNLDWPERGASPQEQQADLVAMLDELRATGINAVFFQVRPEADALYDSELEPWSYWLTGTQGQAPDPYYDPLAFAIEEAHKRGMELHAWFNPYRAVQDASRYQRAPNHVSVTNPDWILDFGKLKVLNPGIPDVRDYVCDVVMDVVERYDIDGVHFDDYFYPYPPNQITNQDAATFREYNTLGFPDIATWRRYNVNMLVKQVYELIEAVKPDVKFGISPFGIWKSGTPPGISGLSAYDVIFASAVDWMEQGWVDYLVPQLYWAFGGRQDYGKLASWWASVASGRHIYPGHALYRNYSQDELPRQVRFNRENAGIQGSVFYHAENLLINSLGFADILRSSLYRSPALTPPIPWNDRTPPGTPSDLTYTWTRSDVVTLQWNAPARKQGQARTVRYAIYRVQSATEPDPRTILENPENLVAVTGETKFSDAPAASDTPCYYLVTAVSPNSIESPPSNFVSIYGRASGF